MILEKGKIISVSRHRAEVEIFISTDCGKCRACLFPVPEQRIISAYNSLPAKPGDRVIVEIRDRKVFSGIILFLFPLSLFLTGYIIGFTVLKGNELISAGAGLAGMSVSFLLISLCSRKFSLNARIKEIIPG